MNKKVLIIEPHGDDAYISLFTVLDTPEIQKHVITLNGRDSQGITSIFENTTTTYLDIDELHYSLKPDISTHDIHRRYLAGEDVYDYYKSKVKSLDAYESTVRMIEDILKQTVKESYDAYFIPLGLEHPYHIAVAEACNNLFKDNVVLYEDKPYAGKRYNREIRDSYLKNSYQRSIRELTESQKKKKSDNFLKVYPTEKSLLVWTRYCVLEDPDILYERSINNESIECS